MKLCPKPSASRRPGLAPLEMVLALPLLIFIAALLYKIGEFGLIKLKTNLDVRTASWKQRPLGGNLEEPPLPRSKSRLMHMDRKGLGTPDYPLSSGLADATSKRPVPLAPFWQPDEARARLIVLIDSFGYGNGEKYPAGYPGSGKEIKGISVVLDSSERNLAKQFTDAFGKPSTELAEKLLAEVTQKAEEAFTKQSEFFAALPQLYEMVSDPLKAGKDADKIFEAIGHITDIVKAFGDLSDLVKKLTEEAPY